MNSLIHYPPQWCRGSGLDCGSGDLGSIPGVPSPRVGPPMARRLVTSSDVVRSAGTRTMSEFSRTKLGNWSTVS